MFHYISVKPEIDRMNLGRLRVRVGQIISFDVNIKGEPPPKVTWSLEDRELRSGGRLKIDNPDYATHFHMRNSDRSDSGLYKIHAENVNGEDNATVEVIVMDKPGPPEGPLVAEDIHADHCTLNWNPPQDDGRTLFRTL